MMARRKSSRIFPSMERSEMRSLMSGDVSTTSCKVRQRSGRVARVSRKLARSLGRTLLRAIREAIRSTSEIRFNCPRSS